MSCAIAVNDDALARRDQRRLRLAAEKPRSDELAQHSIVQVLTDHAGVDEQLGDRIYGYICRARHSAQRSPTAQHEQNVGTPFRTQAVHAAWSASGMLGFTPAVAA